MPLVVRFFLLLCLSSGCAASSPYAASASGAPLIQNNTSDPELTELASVTLSQQLALNGVPVDLYNFEARLDPIAGGGLQIQILCSSRRDQLLKANVRVKGHGSTPKRQIASMMAKAARELAVDCR